MWSILENVLCELEKYVYFGALGWNAPKITIRFIRLSVSFQAAVSVDFQSGRFIHWSQWGVKIPRCDCISVDLSLYVHQDLLYIFRCSYVGCIKAYCGYILLLDWPLYHWIVFFVSYYSLGFKVYLCSKEKEGAYTLCNGMDGTGEHYAKWNNFKKFRCNLLH